MSTSRSKPPLETNTSNSTEPKVAEMRSKTYVSGLLGTAEREARPLFPLVENGIMGENGRKNLT